MSRRQRFEIVKIDKKCRETILNSELISHTDAILAVSFNGLPDDTEKIQVRTADTKEFIWELYRR